MFVVGSLFGRSFDGARTVTLTVRAAFGEGGGGRLRNKGEKGRGGSEKSLQLVKFIFCVFNHNIEV